MNHLLYARNCQRQEKRVSHKPHDGTVWKGALYTLKSGLAGDLGKVTSLDYLWLKVSLKCPLIQDGVPLVDGPVVLGMLRGESVV